MLVERAKDLRLDQVAARGRLECGMEDSIVLDDLEEALARAVCACEVCTGVQRV
eukprot:CAMPEP_0180086728 /NCGR_PEP_ID=MMETSP0985-20121206/21211_1 /TAXON_ID=483367 /ORGANISM="non described non described, Strain CCMP 2436" /LENGTH=53 /DNA_ID=CAMNT_0022020799 /DNA_START=659 /DNA_END=820 /DNA_ORIENTATION=-